MVFESVKVQALKEIAGGLCRLVVATGAAQVFHFRSWCEDNPPTGGTDALLPIRLLLIHEKAFVESADMFVDLATQHQAGADDEIHISLCGMIPRFIVPQGRSMGDEFRQAHVFQPGEPGCRIPKAGRLQALVVVQQSRADDSNVRIPFQQGEQSWNGRGRGERHPY